jgi:U3 small nucleolar RNA-associated protein 19
MADTAPRDGALARDKALLRQIAQLEADVVASRQNANALVTLLDLAKRHERGAPQVRGAAVRARASSLEYSRQRPESRHPGVQASGAALLALSKCFARFAETGELDAAKWRAGAANERAAKRARSEGAAADAAAKFREWLVAKLHQFVSLALRASVQKELALQVAGVAALLRLVRLQVQREGRTAYGSGSLFSQLVRALLTSGTFSEELATQLVHEYLRPFADLRYFALRCVLSLLSADMAPLHRELHRHLSEQQLGDAIHVTMRNVLQLLLRVKVYPEMPNAETLFAERKEESEAKRGVHQQASSAAESSVRVAVLGAGPAGGKKRARGEGEEAEGGGEEEAPASRLSVQTQRRCLSECWFAFLKLRLPTDLYKTVLVRMEEHILPFVETPLKLGDFLTDSYEIGGVTSLLALSGLFVLISRHNLDYPSFFPKLYRLCRPYVFHTKYASRFCRLVDLFLTSTHLPAYIIAAFAKRFARIALLAPPSSALFACALVFNLVKRHPTCRVLLRRPRPAAALPTSSASSSSSAPIDAPAPAPEPRGADPFLAEEDDLAKCNAIESSLWEIKSLTSHYLPHVARLARLLWEEAAPRKEVPIDEVAEHTFETLLARELSWRNGQLMPLAFARPEGLFSDPGAEEAFLDDVFVPLSRAKRA